MAQYLAGTSTCILGDQTLADAICGIAAAGFDCIEISTSLKNYLEDFDLPHRYGEYAALAAREGIALWSLHLPFSRVYDISSEDDNARSDAVSTNLSLIDIAHEMGIGTVVLHPSSEPIADAQRAERMRRSRDGILRHVERAARHGMCVAVEDLPRTCLCNTAEEMCTLLDGTEARVCFDTNHCLKEDSVAFLDALHKGGAKVQTLHLSDYDRIDERHILPGTGTNDWKGILDALARMDYAGPMMYEVGQYPRSYPGLVNTPADVRANFDWLMGL